MALRITNANHASTHVHGYTVHTEIKSIAVHSTIQMKLRIGLLFNIA